MPLGRSWIGDAGGDPRDDLASFWLRKTRKPVLAVLLVEKEDGSGPQLYRGTNMEVSLCTRCLPAFGWPFVPGRDAETGVSGHCKMLTGRCMNRGEKSWKHLR